MSKKIRKIRPNPPYWAWYELDGCWFCHKQNACGGCKVMKRLVAQQKEKQRNKNKYKIDNF